MEKNKELIKECISLFTDYNLRFDELEFLHSFITYCYTGDYDLAIDRFKKFLEDIKCDYHIQKIYDIESELFYLE
jgi:hypothetical protein